jgi:hypothetical protein
MINPLVDDGLLSAAATTGGRGRPYHHAEHLVQKLMPATAKEQRLLTMVRDLMWRFYKALKAYKQDLSPQAVPAFRRRFDRIFTPRTGYEPLDKLLGRLRRRKNELLKVLDHPGIPLHTNASENDLWTFVTKRKISGGTMSTTAVLRATSCLA